jgi:membrane-associated phospholipid phosphatase
MRYAGRSPCSLPVHRLVVAACVCATATVTARDARSDERPPEEPPARETQRAEPPAQEAQPAREKPPTREKQREVERAKKDMLPLPRPMPAEPPAPKVRFIADPVSDGAILSVALGFGGLSELIIGTGEITPQQPVDKARLLSIDRGAVTASPSPAWTTVSNIGLFTASAFALLDPVMTGFRENPEAGIVDAFIYSETLAVNWATTNLAKISVRRPRPRAYQQQEELRAQAEANGVPEDQVPNISETDSSLSFFSGHAAFVASVSTTATYLAFARSPKSIRPWLTLFLGATLTAVVAHGRVEAGAHFPTDVMAGAMAGVGIGLLVPHLHREESLKQRPVWLGLAPGGDGIALSGLF